MDALLNLANSYYTLDIAYTIVVTRPPCLACLKVLLNTDIKVIRLTSKEYPDRDEVKAIWLKAGNIWETQS
jgi:deoxycytidylate deaminase